MLILMEYLNKILKVSGINADIVAAVDINPNANLVYKHNFKNTRVIQKTIEVMKI